MYNRTHGALGPGGRLLIVAAPSPAEATYSLHWLNLPSGKFLRTVTVPQAIRALSFAPVGFRFAVGVGNDLKIYDASSGEVRLTLSGHEERVHACAFAPDARTLVSSCEGKTLRFWDLTNGRAIKTIRLDHAAFDLAWSRDGQTAYSKGARQPLKLWGPDGRAKGEITVGAASTHLAVSEADELLAGSWLYAAKPQPGQATRARLKIDTDDPNKTTDDDRLRTLISASALAGQRAAVATGRKILLFDATADGNRQEPQFVLGGRERGIRSVAVSSNGHAVGWAAERGQPPTRAFDLTTLRFVKPDARPQRARHELGGLTAKLQNNNAELVIAQGGTTLQTHAVQVNRECREFTFIGPDRVIAVGDNGVRSLGIDGKAPTRKFFGGVGSWSVAPLPDGKHFVTGAQDGTIALWQLGRGTPVLTLYAVGNDWIAWTPEGYYAASPAGEKLMGWLVGEKPDQPATFYPCEQFRKTYYRPDAIAKLLSAGSLEAALAKVGTPKAAVPAAVVLPPKVTILSPEAGPLTGPAVSVKAVAEGSDKNTVTAVRLFVDGRPFEGTRGTRSGHVARKEQSWNLTLAPGTHTLGVVAEGSVSTSLPAEIEVVVPAADGAAARPLPRLYMLAIGIDAYAAGWELKCCKKDAVGLTETILKVNKKGGAFSSIESKLVLDKDADRAGILAGLDWLKAKAGPQDVAIMFYGGHGDADDKGEFHLLSATWAPNKKDATVTGTELKEKLADLPCRVLLFLDACHSGAAAQKGKRIAPKLGNLSNALTGEAGVIVAFAAGADELAGEDTKTGHGYFTKALIEGLSGAADKNPQDGVVHLTELLGYVEHRAAQLSDDEQHPTYDKPGSVRSFALAKP